MPPRADTKPKSTGPSDGDLRMREAEAAAKRQRFACLPLLKINERIASPAHLALYARIKASKDADVLDVFLADPAVVDLFRIRVLFYGDTAP